MPFISVELLAGRTLDAHRRFAEQVTAAAVECLDAAPENVRIRFRELDPLELAIGGRLVADRNSSEQANVTAR
jgi:4-oxalocrotonate tautomerase family enzyme